MGSILCSRPVRFVAAAFAIGFLILSVVHLRSVVVSESYRADFDLYYFGAVAEHDGPYTNNQHVVAVAKQDGRRVTSDGVFGAPALVALVFAPLTLLPVHAAEIVWDLAVTVLVFLAMRAAGGQLWPLYLCALLATNSMMAAMQYANASLLTLALVAFAYAALRDKHHVRAGVLLGAATALKLYPGFLLVVLIAERKWNAVKWFAVTALGLTVVAVPILGWHDFLQDAERLLAVGQTHKIWSDNNTFAGVVAYVSQSLAAAQIVNLLGLIAGATLLIKWRTKAPEYTLALAVGLMLLTQSLSWGHYYTLTIIPLIAVTTLVRDRAILALAWLSYLIANLPSFTWIGQPAIWAPGLAKVVSLSILTACLAKVAFIPRTAVRQD